MTETERKARAFDYLVETCAYEYGAGYRIEGWFPLAGMRTVDGALRFQTLLEAVEDVLKDFDR